MAAMKLLAISGSARRSSTNTALLETMRQIAPSDMEIRVFKDIAGLPVFSPDDEGPITPQKVQGFFAAIRQADGLIISSPEYVRSLPGGLKNAIDWLVSGEIIIHKPVVLAHASHRGDDMLATLRVVLETVSTGFAPDPFIRFSLMKMSPDEIRETLTMPENARRVTAFLADVRAFVASSQASV